MDWKRTPEIQSLHKSTRRFHFIFLIPPLRTWKFRSHFPFIQKIQRRSLYNSNPSHEPPTTTKSSPGKVRVLQAPIPTLTSPSSSSSLLVAIETRHFKCWMLVLLLRHVCCVAHPHLVTPCVMYFTFMTSNLIIYSSNILFARPRTPSVAESFAVGAWGGYLNRALHFTPSIHLHQVRHCLSTAAFRVARSLPFIITATHCCSSMYDPAKRNILAVPFIFLCFHEATNIISDCGPSL